MSFLEMIIRTAVSFIVLYIMARILNKKLISQMTFFDFLAGVSMGSIVGSMIFTSNVRLDIGLAGLVLFGLLVLIIDVWAVKSFRARKIFNSEPTVLMKNGKILEEGMVKVRLTMDQLLGQLRKKGIFYLDEVELAVLETDGTVSVLRHPLALPATRGDVNSIKPSRGQPQVFILNGHLLASSLQAMGKDKQWVENTLRERGITDMRDVIVAQMDTQNRVYIDTRQDRLHSS